LRLPTQLPAGRLVKCPHCTGTFAVHKPAVPAAATSSKPQAPAAPAKSSPPPAKPSPAAAAAPPRTPPVPVHKVTCPKCRTTLRTPAALTAGRLSKCPRCATVFRMPRPPVKPAAAPGPAKAPAGTYTWVKCPKCRTVLRLPGTVPPGKSVKCGQCTNVFLVPGKPTRQDGAKTTTLAKPQPPPKAAAPRPVMYLDCPGCKTALKLTGKLPLGQALKCPKCARPVRLLPKKAAAKTKLAAATARKTKLAAARAKKTSLAAGPAKPTKLAAVPAKQTKLAAAPAKPTKLAAAPAKQTKLAAAPAKQTKLAAPAKQTKLAAAPAKQTKLAATAATPRPAAAQATQPQAAVRPRSIWIKLVKSVLYVALAGVLAALGLVGAGFFGYGPLAPRGEIPASAWQEVAPPGGGYRVLMPGEPKQLKGSPKGIGGADARNFVVSWRDEAEFFLSFWDWPAAARTKDPLKDLGATVEDRLRDQFEGIVVQRRDISLNGHAGREWVIEPATGGILIARLYQVKGISADRYYVLSVLADGTRLKPAAARFFDSFRIE